MLRSIKEIYGKTLGTSEGDVGHVKDFYFSDQQWVVRYIVVDTGSFLPGRQVLITPHAFGNLSRYDDWQLVNLTRQQLEDSPPIESHKPVARQYEEEYYRYYGWPSYWDGGGVWGATGFPTVGQPEFPHNQQAELVGESHDGEEAHLRSMKALIGYHIQTSDGTIGHVADFIMDDHSWTIQYLVIETGSWFSGKEIVISPKQIDCISYEDSIVTVSLTKESILNAPPYNALPFDTGYRPEIVKAPSVSPVSQR